MSKSRSSISLTLVVLWLAGCGEAPIDPPITPTHTPGLATATPAAVLLPVQSVDDASQTEIPTATTTEIHSTKQPVADITLEETGQLDDNASALRTALIEKTGIEAEKLEFTIAQNTETHAKGMLKHKDEISGAYFIAAKVDNRWIIVYDGQATPGCTEIAPYDFPIGMVPECLDGENNLFVRIVDR